MLQHSVATLLLAWVLAALVKKAIEKGAALGKLDERLNKLERDEEDKVTVSQSLATAGYWLVFLLFLPMVLSALQMESLVAPLQSMFDKLFELPAQYPLGTAYLRHWLFRSQAGKTDCQ